MKKVVYLLLMILSAQYGNAQTNIPTINKETLKQIIKEDSEHKYFAVFIFTSGCGGGKFINHEMNILDSITNGKTKMLLAHATNGNSEDRNKKLDLAISAWNINKEDIYFIDNNLYKIVKKDSREQGMRFRDDICVDCKFMTIGTVYKLIFDKNFNLMYHGFFSTPQQMSAILATK